MREAIALLEGRITVAIDPEEINDRILRSYRFILVDEYQDIDEDQYALVSALAGRTAEDPDRKLTILAVGDDDQNIYAFRQASLRFIRRFRDDYHAEASYLVENYRSSKHIINASNALISANRERMKTEAPIEINRARSREPAGGRWETIDHAVSMGRVQILDSMASAEIQAYAVMQEILRLKALNQGAGWGDFAILARTRKALHHVRAYCEQKNIPHFWGEDRDRRPQFHHIREIANFTGILREMKGKVITAGGLLLMIQPSATNLRCIGESRGNIWYNLLIQCMEEYREITADLPLPVENALDWIYEFGTELRRGAGKCIWLNTVHSSKGTEFPHVFILDGWQVRDQEIEEERRLFYVAMTRARETLTLCRITGSPNPFVASLLDHPSTVRRVIDIKSPAGMKLNLFYETIGPSQVDLGYAGRRAPHNPVHDAIRQLNVGDILHLEKKESSWLLFNSDKRIVGRLSKAYTPPSGTILSVRVTAILKRTIEMVQNEEWKKACAVPEWEVPLCEIVYE